MSSGIGTYTTTSQAVLQDAAKNAGRDIQHRRSPGETKDGRVDYSERSMASESLTHRTKNIKTLTILLKCQVRSGPPE